MHIKALKIRNFRRLQNVLVDLDSNLSIFVGANNSGKTSVCHALHLFTSGARDRFSLHDFCSECWNRIEDFGERRPGSVLPKISIDIWFHVEAADLHRVIDILPSLDWQGSSVGLRVEFGAVDEAALIGRFNDARTRARAGARPDADGRVDFHPMPRTLKDYLEEHLSKEFELRYFVLDRQQFDEDLEPNQNYSPLEIVPDRSRTGKEILNSLVRVDILHAQRHLSDHGGVGRAEDLSKCLSRFYKRNLEKRGEDFDALRALIESEEKLSDHLQRVFEPTLSRLADLGYPGIANPRLLIKSALNPAMILSRDDGARVHYALSNNPTEAEPPTLPDRYNGLGFKNLIYMVVELLDLHAQWIDVEDRRPPLHLIFIEEPEAHMHAQLQQVFIRKVMDILEIEADDRAHYHSQIVVTTHSPHVLYERGFRPIRYFRRVAGLLGQSSEVLNLSEFYDETQNPTRDFLERYLKLTHCDLFFADAAILVEGNVERLLLPQIIASVAPGLKRTYLSILEIGGAFGHRFRSLIEFLGITTLIITDIDSVTVANNAGGAIPEDIEDGEDEEVAGTSCMVHEVGAVTSNQTLIQWLPARTSVADLLAATADQKTQARRRRDEAHIRVTYQTSTEVRWGDEVAAMTGRTLEEAFALQNLEWCMDEERSDLKLRCRNADTHRLDEIAAKIHKKIKGSRFNKTDFALALLAQDPTAWVVPSYITEGLLWLEGDLLPPATVVEVAAQEET